MYIVVSRCACACVCLGHHGDLGGVWFEGELDPHASNGHLLLPRHKLHLPLAGGW